MFSFFIFFLIIIIPGFIAGFVYDLVSKRKVTPCCSNIFVIISLIFDLIILIINLAGLYIFKGICEFTQLKCYFNCLSFTSKYALLSIAVGIVLAICAGIITRLVKKCFKSKFVWKRLWLQCNKILIKFVIS